MYNVKEIDVIENKNLEYINEFFSNTDSSLYLTKLRHNYCVYHNEEFPIGNEFVTDLNKTELSSFNNQELIGNLQELIKFLSLKYHVSFMWLMVYPPKTGIIFHKDERKNRHTLVFNEDEKFFNYEADSMYMGSQEMIDHLNNKMKENEDSIETFNEFYSKLDDTCFIRNLKQNIIYSFGNTLHTFYNDSKKYRFNLVFEIA